MLDLKSLNTILFSNKESELKIAIKKISDQFEPEKAKNILAYAKTYNSNLLTEVDKLSKIVSDEEIINQFYNSETISPFFGFSSFKHLEEAKKSISQVQINTVKKNYSKLEIKNKELANAKKSSNSSVAQKLEQEIGKLQASLNNSPSQTALKILQHDIAKSNMLNHLN
ncbi:hypothetical protein [Rickettsia bellii]|uniref:Uncharacterized protein n=1 Tax=Rickettsia bellii str. RML Mogi TaxID=1359194 RepID=A0A0F3QKT1_RICBE|nr:hypothetical protein [Rickettsia bellii]KJV92852.1 hypothetical protein RBEMOGI_1489 [Rickettsia bellii str. RML Mogi]